MVTWAEWEYREIGRHLELGDPCSKPEFWETGIPAREATTETLLALHLETITGLQLQLCRRANPMEASADIVATDALARVHLVELKKKAFTGAAAAQLEQYLLQHVFTDAEHFLATEARRGRSQVTLFELARDIIGVWANLDAQTFGIRGLISALGRDHDLLNRDGRPLTMHGYKRVDDTTRLELVHAGMHSHGVREGLTVPELDSIIESAEVWSARFDGADTNAESNLVADRRLVLWLVGARINPDAVERVRRWRRAGIDARVLEIAGKSDGTRWVLGIRRENLPQRERAEHGLFALSGDPNHTKTRVEAVFYEERSASTGKHRGGDPLADPIIKLR